jgi:signal transduction histidine kinase/DNA-binding LacI/PurR family transcriptional regulator/AraC-like DNA-binding protein/ActR/RegA family two-component response regulator
MSKEASNTAATGQGRRPTIGVIGNRQIYEGTTIVRYEQSLLRGIRAAAQQYGCSLLLACGVGPDIEPYEGLAAWPVRLPQTNVVPVGPRNTSGLIAIPPFSDAQQRALQELAPPGYPIVFTFPQQGYPSVVPANGDGIAQAFAHLVAHGHRRIAFIATDAHPVGDGAERLAAYQSAVAAHGLPLDRALIGYGGHNTRESYHALRRMLDAGADFTAVLASNDESAIGVLRALADAGRRVPEDVAVIGFDDVLYARAQLPPLTTVRHPTFELGYRTVELLLDYIAGRRTEVTSVRVPTQLIVRESCGCRPYSALTPATLRPEAAADVLALAQAMAEAVSAESRHSGRAELDAWCGRLAAAFFASLAADDPRPFAAALDQILQDVETADDDAYAWQAAVSVLRDRLDALPAPRLAARMIDQARVRISERLRGQHTRFLMREAELIERIGAMTMRLLTALELRQILAILADHLPPLGIRHAHIALFEAEGDDQEVWSNLHTCAAADTLAPRRFRTQEFPPPGLFDTAEPFRLALLPLIVEGGPSGFVAFDAAYLEPCGLIVRHIAAALRNSQLHAAAEEGRRLAEEANRVKSRFLSTVSHELRTPLNLIVGLSDMLLRDRAGAAMPADSAAQDLERIYANAQHLGRLIGDVLDLASSEAGQLRLYQEPLELAEVLQPVVATGARMAREKGLAWHARLPAAELWVCGDRTRLRQVALNLLSNAVKFTDGGSVALEVSADATHATVAVRDTGLGVPREDQQQIFAEFRSSERTAGRGYGGLGLGLAICKQLIERQGGTIGVCSSGEEDGGATFFFSLPLIAAGAQQAAPGPPPAARPRVIVLGEHAQAGAPLEALLDQCGFDLEVQRADLDSGWLSRLAAGPPAALILEAELAARRGWEILSVLKRHPATARLPVLMYALDARAGRGSLLELDYLLKPLDPEQLARALELRRAWDDQPSEAQMILVVDDDPETLALHTRLIQQQLPGSRVAQARDGREALAAMERARPDLVLLDLMMPELDGFGVLEAMRGRPATRDVPVVVLTAQMLTEHDIARLNAGVAAILSKGLFSAGEIAGHLESALRRQRKLGPSMQQVVRRAAALIHTRYAEQLTRDQLAAQVGVSGDYLTACFRQEMGVTPIAYLNRYRISRARALLEEGGRSVTEVALSVGFSDLANFSHTFHREVGMTPSAYRRAHQR